MRKPHERGSLQPPRARGLCLAFYAQPHARKRARPTTREQRYMAARRRGTNVRRSNSTRRNAVIQYVRASGEPCWICGMPIDRSVPQGNALCCECDELIPVAHGGSPFLKSNVHAAHRCCNSWRGAKTVRRVQMIQQAIIRQGAQPKTPLEFVAAAQAVEKNARVRLKYPKTNTTTKWL